MEVGRFLGRVVSWPFTYGCSLVWGDDDGAAADKGGGPMATKVQRSLRQVNRESVGEWTLSPTLSSPFVPSALRTSSTLSGSLDDLTRLPSFGSADEVVEEGNHSILSVPIPIEEESFQAYLAGLPDTAFPRYRLVLPKKPKILVLDLDETLVHSTSTGALECDFLVEVLVEHMSCLYYVHKRPFVEHFIDVVSSWYQLAIYTASLREYADPVVNMLDKGRRLFSKRLFRNACKEKDGMYLKDLTLVDQDLSRVFLLDNSAISFILNPENGIFIDGWVDDKKDSALLDLLPFLDALRFVEDVRSILSFRAFS